MKDGQKYDHGKPRFSLLPMAALWQVIAVLEFGAAKYGADNWQQVDNAKTRYFDACHRHLSAWWAGERLDSESGLPHLAHAVCCLLFLMWGD
ncbi:dATP/dGTP diphosphohydrolase domain-containing protein [Moraxella sp. ZJ142]|uniref:dATP/dGTP diphosphohydrolase domain-containing protein n=1 Tax=Moraxella marmotae TaxID=3344520 RepID=UPI0035D4DFF8